jgi:hypothetical protein
MPKGELKRVAGARAMVAEQSSEVPVRAGHATVYFASTAAADCAPSARFAGRVSAHALHQPESVPYAATYRAAISQTAARP